MDSLSVLGYISKFLRMKVLLWDHSAQLCFGWLVLTCPHLDPKHCSGFSFILIKDQSRNIKRCSWTKHKWHFSTDSLKKLVNDKSYRQKLERDQWWNFKVNMTVVSILKDLQKNTNV